MAVLCHTQGMTELDLPGEIFSTKGYYSRIPGNKFFARNRKQLNKKARRGSGGVNVRIRNDTDVDNVMWFKTYPTRHDCEGETCPSCRRKENGYRRARGL